MYHIDLSRKEGNNDVMSRQNSISLRSSLYILKLSALVPVVQLLLVLVVRAVPHGAREGDETERDYLREKGRRLGSNLSSTRRNKKHAAVEEEEEGKDVRTPTPTELSHGSVGRARKTSSLVVVICVCCTL